MLKIKGFTKIYTGGKKAVDNLNLEIKDGEKDLQFKKLSFGKSENK